MKKLFLLLVLISFLLIGCTPNEDVDVDVNIETKFHPVSSMDTVELNNEWNDMGAVMTVDDITIVGETVLDNVDTTTLGLYTVTYEVEYKGTTYETIRYVIVVDQTPPEATLNPGIDTVEKNTTWIDTGIETSDNSGETVTVTVIGTVNTSLAGIYEIEYTATDSSGNIKTITRFVHVVN